MSLSRRTFLFATAGAATAAAVPWSAARADTPATYPVAVDYGSDAGAERHVAGGNLHPFDDRGPAAWLTDGLSIVAVRGQDYSKRQNPFNEYLPGWFEPATYARLRANSPDAKLMIGTYYGFKGKVAAGGYDGNTDWQALASQNGGTPYREWIAAELADGKQRKIDVYSWILWNEPNLQWRSRDAYFQGYLNGYQAIKDFDPSYRVQGPETSGYSLSYLTAFLTFCQANNCLPDVLSWHALSRSRVAIEDNAKEITAWLQANNIPVMPFAITEYQGSSYSTTEDGRRQSGNYNPGLAVSFIGELERASESTSVSCGLRSEWGLSGSDPNARGFLGEMATFDDQGKMATGLWHVYNTYWDMTGRKVGTTHDKTKIDVLATYDKSHRVNKSGILVGNWEEDTKVIPVTLTNLPKRLVQDGELHLDAHLIRETLATPSYGTESVASRKIRVTRQRATFYLTLPGRTACRVFLTPPADAPLRYSPIKTAKTRPAQVRTTGEIELATKRLGEVRYCSFSGGQPSSYRTAAGEETAVESGDSVTYLIDVARAGTYDLISSVVRTASGAFLQLYVDGESTGSPFDLYAAQTGLVTYSHGNLFLSKGRHRVSYRIVGAGKNTASSGFDISIHELRAALSYVAP